MSTKADVAIAGHVHKTAMTDTATRCLHAIDIDDCACATHAQPEATVGMWVGGSCSVSCMDDRRSNKWIVGGENMSCQGVPTSEPAQLFCDFPYFEL